MLRVMSDSWHKGFQMIFENGWTVSIQFGKANYADNPRNADQCTKAEIAAWNQNDVWHKFANGDTVSGWATADEVAEFIAMIAAKD